MAQAGSEHMPAAAPKKQTPKKVDGAKIVLAHATNGPRSGDARLRPTTRQPAPALGPRAAQTIEKILVATKEIFLKRGYAGTSVDEIAQRADVSRASFYTYFPSKRDALLTLGAKASTAANVVADRLAALASRWTFDDLHAWVVEYFEFLHDHGAFSLAWTQAAQEDDALRRAGMKRHLALCTRLGGALGKLRGQAFSRPTDMGLLVFSMFDRVWSFGFLYQPNVDLSALQRQTARAVEAIVRGVNDAD